MEVVLLERVAKLGQMGDVVTVKQGYARNFLLPQGKALRATPANLKRFETDRAQLEVRNLELKREAEAVAARLDGQTFVVIRSASDGGALYGSVTTRDAAEAATAGGFSIDRRQLVLNAPIKELGLHRIVVALHPEVEATITINVARSDEEAVMQRGPPSGGRGDDHDQRRAQRRGSGDAGLGQDDPGTSGRGRCRGRVRHRGALRRHRRGGRRRGPGHRPLSNRAAATVQETRRHEPAGLFPFLTPPPMAPRRTACRNPCGD